MMSDITQQIIMKQKKCYIIAKTKCSCKSLQFKKSHIFVFVSDLGELTLHVGSQSAPAEGQQQL